MRDQEFIELLREALDLESDELLSMTTELESAPWWDSLSIISTISLLRTAFGVMVSAKDVGQCMNIAEVKKLAEKK